MPTFPGPRNKYIAIRDDKPKSNDEAKRPEFKVCKFTTDAIVTEGSEIGTTHKICANPACSIHHPKKAYGASANDAQFKAEQEKRRREEAIANTTGLPVLFAISAAVPVRLMKRDLLFVAECMVNLLDENRAAIVAKQHVIKKTKENESVSKLFCAELLDRLIQQGAPAYFGPYRFRGYIRAKARTLQSANLIRAFLGCP